MGRPPKNPGHVLVRLREAISRQDKIDVTRKMLAERSGVSSSTLRQIEIGGLRLTDAVAEKLFRGTGVSPESLLRNDDPLLDPYGVPLDPDSLNVAKLLWVPEFIETHAAVLVALFHAAEKRGQAMSVSMEFSSWLEKTARLFGLDALVRQQLAERGKMDVFYSGCLPESLRPRDPESKRRWEEFKTRMTEEREGKVKEGAEEYLKRSSQKRPRSPGRPPA
jgi:transcriptional regulator with XRE-family HTH domain